MVATQSSFYKVQNDCCTIQTGVYFVYSVFPSFIYRSIIGTPIYVLLSLFVLGAEPTLLELMVMPKYNGMTATEAIAAGNYKLFRMHLLQDVNGALVALIENDHISQGVGNVTIAILQRWLTSEAHTSTGSCVSSNLD